MNTPWYVDGSWESNIYIVDVEDLKLAQVSPPPNRQLRKTAGSTKGIHPMDVYMLYTLTYNIYIYNMR